MARVPTQPRLLTMWGSQAKIWAILRLIRFIEVDIMNPIQQTAVKSSSNSPKHRAGLV